MNILIALLVATVASFTATQNRKKIEYLEDRSEKMKQIINELASAVNELDEELQKIKSQLEGRE